MWLEPRRECSLQSLEQTEKKQRINFQMGKSHTANIQMASVLNTINS